jgi:predicted Zn-ribbon and HTH transcriptional regulator
MVSVKMSNWNQKSMENLKHEDSTRRCPECKSEDLEFGKGELVCKKCGLVIE